MRRLRALQALPFSETANVRLFSSSLASTSTSTSESYTPFVPKADAWVWTEPFPGQQPDQCEPVTAYKFLKNRGPKLTIAYVHKLFDKGLVRVWGQEGRCVLQHKYALFLCIHPVASACFKMHPTSTSDQPPIHSNDLFINIE